ncbi:MAG: cytochrome c3 family protein [Desulfuromonadaceae bacterium]|nr:cytochrome c3 family protein [Desulfuromonadaceae bacterium]
MPALDRSFPPRLILLVALVLALFVPPLLCQAGSASEVFLLAADDSCLDCHDDLLEQQYKHAAIDDRDSCTLCHPLADPSQHTPTRPGKNVAELCWQCHDAFAGSSATHGPVATGECTACHDPHSAAQAKLLRQAQPTLCWSCHDKTVEDAQKIQLPATKPLFEDKEAILHPPFADGGCNDCHLPHASDQPRLLNAAYPAGFYQSYSTAAYELCLNCHDSAAFNAARTLTATAFRNGNLNLHYRHVNKDKGRSCRACHSAHGGYQARLVTQSFRFGDRLLGVGFAATASGGSCTTNCHIKANYDRLEPAFNPLRTSPRPPGQNATPEELQHAGNAGSR